MKLILLIAAVFTLTVSVLAKELPTNGLLLYREHPDDDVEALNFFSVTPGLSDSLLVLVDGGEKRVWNAGIVAKLEYPPSDWASVSSDTAQTMIHQAHEMGARFPTYTTDMTAIAEKWEKVETFALLREFRESQNPKTAVAAQRDATNGPIPKAPESGQKEISTPFLPGVIDKFKNWGQAANEKFGDWNQSVRRFADDHPEMGNMAIQVGTEALRQYLQGGGSSGPITETQASDAGRTLQQYRQQQGK